METAKRIADATIYDVAIQMARRNRLLLDGVIVCWNCGDKPALIPSLHCPHCLAAHWTRMGQVGTCVNRQQTPEDVEACK